MNSMIVRSPNLADGDVPCVVRLYEVPRFKSGGLARAAQAVRSAGRGGDDILLHINEKELQFLKHAWGEPSHNPHTGLPEYGLFSKIKKALKFEVFNTKNIVKGVLKNPQRLLTGAVDPLGTKISNKMFGSHYDPLVNQLGGATEKTFKEAEAKGMDTGLARNLHKVAGAVAGFYGGQALGQLAGTGLEQASWAMKGGEAARAAQAANAAQGLQEVIPTATKIAQGATPGSLVQMSQPLGSTLSEVTPSVSKLVAENTSPLTSALDTGAAKLGDLKGAALDYAKDPKHWGTIAKGVGALGLLGGAGGKQDEDLAPDMPKSPGLKQLPYSRMQTMPNMDWYTYGERGPEASFYNDNAVPAFTPEEPTGHRAGGAIGGGGEFGGAGADDTFPEQRFVRGPGTGRSDDIPARLSNGEYVLTAEDVAMLGDGSSEAGAKALDGMRRNLRMHKGGALSRGKISPNAKSPLAYIKGAR